MVLPIDPDQFTNVFIFVSDGLRYDTLRDSEFQYGTVSKTISCGVSTPTAFSSMITGQYPPVHNVHRFSNRLNDDFRTVFDLFPNGVFETDTEHTGPITEVLNLEHLLKDPLSEIDTPFLYMYRDLSPHAPRPLSENGVVHDSVSEYWKERKRDSKKMHLDYERGVRDSIDRFEELLHQLKERGILDETLVIFTADHGELLGESGFIGHGPPMMPELIYVPTVFCNEGIEFDQPLAHVDFLPTIAKVAGVDISNDPTPGYDLTESVPSDRTILAHSWLPYVEERGVWGVNGGQVFSESSMLDRLHWFKRLVWGGAWAPYYRRGPIKALRTVFRGDRTYDSPQFSREEADELYDSVESGGVTGGRREISEAGKERLEKLGYRDMM